MFRIVVQNGGGGFPTYSRFKKSDASNCDQND